MKSLLRVLAAVVLVSIGAFLSFADDAVSNDKVIIYYFHGSFRCITCTNMEKYSREAIEANFENEIAQGKIEFKEVNVEKSGNEHFVKDYQLYTRSLVLSLVRDGNEIKSKNLTKIWEYARNKQKFFEYINEEVKDFLKEVK